jgi:hypothetical protein
VPNGNANLQSAAISSSGSIVACAVNGAAMYVSRDGGSTFAVPSGQPSGNWKSVAVSGDGSTVYGVIQVREREGEREREEEGKRCPARLPLSTNQSLFNQSINHSINQSQNGNVWVSSNSGVSFSTT